jgi:hypothetical protein
VNSTPESDNGPPPLASVLTVLGGGSESSIHLADLSLEHTYTTSASTKHAVTMTSLTFDQLAADPRNMGISFFHISPGMVKTNGDRELGPIFRVLLAVFIWVFNPWIVSVQECGGRNLWAAMSDAFRERGIHLVGQRSEVIENTKILDELREKKVSVAVWEHTRDVFRKICDEEISTHTRTDNVT